MAGCGIKVGKPEIDTDELRGWKNKVVGRLTGGLVTLAKQRKETVVHGVGEFVSPHHIKVANGDEETVIAFGHCIVAAGSEPSVIPGFPVNPSEDWDEFTPRIGLDWQATENLMLFASYSEGFKAGALEGARATDAAAATSWLEPEKVKTFEVGLKGDWFAGRLRASQAASAG